MENCSNFFFTIVDDFTRKCCQTCISRKVFFEISSHMKFRSLENYFCFTNLNLAIVIVIVKSQFSVLQFLCLMLLQKFCYEQTNEIFYLAVCQIITKTFVIFFPFLAKHYFSFFVTTHTGELIHPGFYIFDDLR